MGMALYIRREIYMPMIMVTVSFGSFQIYRILLKQPETPFTNLDLLEIRGTCGITTSTNSGVTLLIYIMKIRSVT